MLEEKRKRDDEVEEVEADLESLRHEVNQGARFLGDWPCPLTHISSNRLQS